MEFPRDCLDPEAMQGLGAELAREVKGGGVVGLDGELGTGKTELVKGLAREWGYLGVVSSPTFGLLHEYGAAHGVFYHLDFYRVESAEEVLALGWDEILEEPGSLVVVEWAGRFGELFAPDALRLEVEILPGGGLRITTGSF